MAAVIRDKLIALHCAPSCIHNYGRTDLNHLVSAGYLCDHIDSLRHFVKHLPYGSTFDIIWESILHALSTAQTAAQLPSFGSVIEHVTNININRNYFQPSCTCHLNLDTTTTSTTTSKDMLSTTPASTVTPAAQSHPHFANFCTNCFRWII